MARRRKDGPEEIVAKLTHAHSSSFQWSYFFSADRDYVSMYPWVKSDDVIEGQGHSSLKTSIPEWFDYEIYVKGLPRANPERRLYWTDAYKDAGGTGAMVLAEGPQRYRLSHSAFIRRWQANRDTAQAHRRVYWRAAAFAGEQSSRRYATRNDRLVSIYRLEAPQKHGPTSGRNGHRGEGSRVRV
jgi:hypothetical protein